jgi:phage antirepressor YoqD-like protein
MNVNSSRNREARFLSVREYAQHVGRCERTIRQWMFEARFPFIQKGRGAILIDPVKADAALERFEIKEVVVK